MNKGILCNNCGSFNVTLNLETNKIMCNNCKNINKYKKFDIEEYKFNSIQQEENNINMLKKQNNKINITEIKNVNKLNDNIL